MKAESQRIYSIYLPTYIHISQSHILFFFLTHLWVGGVQFCLFLTFSFTMLLSSFNFPSVPRVCMSTYLIFSIPFGA